MKARTLVHFLGSAMAIVAGLIFCSPGFAQFSGLPRTPLWSEEANGDAVQKEIGFILPAKWKTFERRGFTSTREDGASVKAHYLSEDKTITLGIMLQLRADIRGFEMPRDMLWSLLQAAGDVEYARTPQAQRTELSSGPFSIRGRQPAGRMRWTRFELDSGAQVQGLWWQDIGVWSVIVTMSGPEARRADMEAQASMLFAEMPFPSAPITAELRAVGTSLFGSMAKCKGSVAEGQGGETQPLLQEVTVLGLIMPRYVLPGDDKVAPLSPVTRAQDYCVIETFSAGKNRRITAIAFSGAESEAWEARYGFAVDNGTGGYFQVERPKVKSLMESLFKEPVWNHTYLDFSDHSRAVLFAAFDDWPSYKNAKQAVKRVLDNKLTAIVTATGPASHPNGAVTIDVGNGHVRPQPAVQ